MSTYFHHVRKRKRWKHGSGSFSSQGLSSLRAAAFAAAGATLSRILVFTFICCFCVSAASRTTPKPSFKSASCEMDSCITHFLDRLELLGPEFEGADFASASERMRSSSSLATKRADFCHLLTECGVCLDSVSARCYVDLSFRAARKIVTDWKRQFDCDRVAQVFSITPAADAQLQCTFVPPDAPDGENEADAFGDDFTAEEQEDAHCSLFGDPHLVRYDGRFQTCVIEGAWPLVDNQYLAIQVTSEKVCRHCVATAAVRVTVIVKDAGECGPQSTYEASSQSLPKSFNDGTTFAGLDKSTVIDEKVEGREVQIRVRHAGSVVSVRRVGGIGQFPSLSVSVQTPRSLTLSDGRTTELCAVGCPDHASLKYPDQSLRLDVDGEQAAKACLRRGLTDAFLDACVFDLISTGDFGFAEAAQLAQTDFWLLNPRLASSALSNRTDPSPQLLVTSDGTKFSVPFVLALLPFVGAFCAS